MWLEEALATSLATLTISWDTSDGYVFVLTRKDERHEATTKHSAALVLRALFELLIKQRIAVQEEQLQRLLPLIRKRRAIVVLEGRGPQMLLRVNTHSKTQQHAVPMIGVRCGLPAPWPLVVAFEAL